MKFNITTNHLTINKRIIKTTEQGRSMVEIIGVLAIIAVLTIGSTIAIQLGFTTQAANNIIADANFAYLIKS